MYYDTQSAPRAENGGKPKVWKIVALAALLLCSLPVLIPLSFCVAAGVLVVALCVAGAAFAAVLCVAGAVFTVVVCVVGGLICLALFQLAALIGIGFGVVLLFQAPASGLAILGESLLATGAGVLCWLLLWQLVRLLIRGFRALVGWTRRRLFAGRGTKRARADAGKAQPFAAGAEATEPEGFEDVTDQEKERKGADDDE